VTGPDTTQVPDHIYDEMAGGANKALPVETGLPANISAEKMILGAILLENQAFNEAAERLVPEDFSLESHQRIYQRMTELVDASHAIELTTLAEELARHKEIESVGGVAYLSDLTEGLPRRPVIDEYIRIVKDKSQLRQLILICQDTLARAADQSETALDVLEIAESQLLQIAQEANTGRLRTIADSVEDAGGPDAYLKAYTEPSTKVGLQTGFVDLDRMTGGLQQSELIIIAARPSMGKTALAVNLMENVCCGSDRVVAFFSLEMSRAAIEHRFMASRARVDVKRAMEGFYLSEREKEKLGGALIDLADARIFVDDSALLTPIQLRAKARRLKQREKRLDLICVDYVQLMTAGSKTGNRQEEVAAVSRSLKACAKELEVPVVALAQLSRNSEQRTDKRPVLSDLRESGQIEQDADLCCFIHRDAYYRPDDPDVQGLADLIVAKSRNGPTGLVKLAFEASLTRFENLARR